MLPAPCSYGSKHPDKDGAKIDSGNRWGLMHVGVVTRATPFKKHGSSGYDSRVAPINRYYPEIRPNSASHKGHGGGSSRSPSLSIAA